MINQPTSQPDADQINYDIDINNNNSISLEGHVSSQVQWFFKKADAIAAGRKMTAPILLVKDYNPLNGSKYTGVIERSVLMQIIQRGLWYDENLYSSTDNVLDGSDPKLFIDIDLSASDVDERTYQIMSEHYDEIYMIAHDWLNHHISKFWQGQPLPEPMVFKSLASDGTYSKISFHIHYNVRFPALYNIRKRFQLFLKGESDYVFPEWWPLTGWTFQNTDGLTKYMMDPAPWGHGVFRLPYQSKKGKDVRLHIWSARTGYQNINVNKFNQPKCWTPWHPEEYVPYAFTTWSLEPLKSTLVPCYYLTPEIMEQLTVTPTEIKKSEAKAVDHMTTPDNDETNPFLKCLSVIPRSSATKTILYNIFAAGKHIINNTADLNERVRIRNTVIDWSMTPQHIETYGYAKCKQYMNRLFNEAESPATLSYMISQARRHCPDIVITVDEITSLIDTLYDSESDMFTPIDIDEYYVRPITTDADTVILRSCMGSGKSTRVKEYIASVPLTKSVLFITNRRVLSRELITQYRDLNFLHYDEIRTPRDLITPRIIVQLESIHLVTRYDKFDIVILDESESLINQLFSPTHCSSLLQHSEQFAYIVTHAEKLFLMDAFISKKTFTLVNGLRTGRTVHYERYARNPRPRMCEVFTAAFNGCNGNMLRQMMEDVTNGKRLYIWSGSLRLLKKISYMIKATGVLPSRMLLITSELSNQQKTTIFEDVNATWSAVDYVLASPSVTVGCNHNVAGHFDKAYIYINSMSTPVRDAVQAMLRCRELNDKKIMISVDAVNDSDVNPHVNALADFYKNGVFISSWHSELHQIMVAEQHVSRHYPLKTLLKLLHEGIFSAHVNTPVKPTQMETRPEESKETDPSDSSPPPPSPDIARDYIWNTSNYVYDNNRIVFDDQSLDECMYSMQHYQENDAEKELYMRHLFQTRTRYQTYWNNSNIDSEYEKFCINGRYRYSLLDTSAPLYLSEERVKSFINIVPRPVTPLTYDVIDPVTKNSEKKESVKTAFNNLYTAQYKQEIHGRNINVAPIHVKRIRIQIIRFMESWARNKSYPLTLDNIMRKNIVEPTVLQLINEKYQVFADWVKTTAAHYGIEIQTRRIKGEVISEVQVQHLFNSLCEKLSVGFEIEKNEKREMVDGVRTRTYSYHLLNYNYLYGIYNDIRNVVDVDIKKNYTPFDLELRQYWRHSFKLCLDKLTRRQNNESNYESNSNTPTTREPIHIQTQETYKIVVMSAPIV